MRYHLFSRICSLLLALGASLAPVAAQPTAPLPSGTPITGLPHWVWQAPQPTGYFLRALQTFPDSAMIAVGGHGTALKTTDGGRVWQVLPTGTDRELESISFADTQRGWVGGPSPVINPVTQWRGGPGRVLRTTTGGATWAAQVFEPQSAWAVEVAAASATVACVAYQAGRIVPRTNIGEELGPRLRRTTNGGQAWALVALPVPVGFLLREITNLSFVSPTTGFVHIRLGGTSRQLLRTTDAGLTWQPIATDSSVTGFVPDRYSFLDSRHGWLAGGNSQTGAGTFYRTRDGGQTWTPLAMPVAFGGGTVGIEFPSFADPARGVLYSRNNRRFYATADSGFTWQEIFTVPEGNATIRALQLRPDGRAWCVGDNGFVATAADYGRSWQRRAPSTTLVQSARDLTMADPTHGWARPYTEYGVEANTRLLRTTTRGAEWTELDLAQRTTSVSWLASRLGAAAFPDRDTLWVGGSDIVANEGFVLRSTDAGATWLRQTLPAAPFAVTDLAHWGGRRIVAIGPQQTLHVTRDAGQTWTRAVVPGTRALQRATWADSATIYVTTDSASLLKSVDAGRTWQLLTPANYSPDAFGRGRKLTFTSPLVGYFGLSSVVARTTDGGLTWTAPPTYTGTPGLFYSPGIQFVAFRTAREGWAVGQAEIYSTRDAGQTWTLQAFVSAGNFPGYGAAAGYDQSSLVDRYNAFNVGSGITRYSEKYIQTDASAAAPRTYCLGETITVPFDTVGTFVAADRHFRVELSNTMGRFRPNETTILPLVGADSLAPLRATLPATLAAGTRYRVRVIRADSSVLGGDNERDLTIWPRPAAVAVAPVDSARICAGDSVQLTAPAGFGQYQWTRDGAPTATTASVWVKTGGTYTVQVALGGNCFGPASQPVTVRVTPRPAAPVVVDTSAGTVRLTATPALPPPASYVWTGPGGVVVPGATGNTLLLTSAAQNGLYSVTLTQRGCASAASAPVQVLIIGLAEDAADAVGLSVAPNPASEAITVRVSGRATGLRTLVLRDLAGRAVLTLAGEGRAAVVVEVAGVPTGTYLLAATLGDGRRVTRRLVVAR